MKWYYRLLFVTLIIGLATSSKLTTIHQWKYLNITPVPREYAVEGSHEDGIYYLQKQNSDHKQAFFNYQKAVPFDVDQSKDGRIFVTIVGKPDVNVSLTTVTTDSAENGPVLAPYPDYSWFLDRNDCSKMISIRSVAIDKCNRLWVLDSGRVDRTQICKAKLLVFDLSTDMHLNSYELPKEISENERGLGVLVNPIVQTEGSTCENITVYIADSEGGALVVFNGTEFRRLEGPEFRFSRGAMNFSVAGEWFLLPGGVTPLDLEPGGERLYFAALASRDLSSLGSAELRAVFRGGPRPAASAAREVYGRQATALRWSAGGLLFAGLTDSSIRCWRRAEHLRAENFDTAVVDGERLQYIAAIKTIPPTEAAAKEQLLIMSNRLQKSIRRTRNFQEINYRIMRDSVENLIEGTACKNDDKFKYVV